MMFRQTREIYSGFVFRTRKIEEITSKQTSQDNFYIKQRYLYF